MGRGRRQDARGIRGCGSDKSRDGEGRKERGEEIGGNEESFKNCEVYTYGEQCGHWMRWTVCHWDS